MLKFVCSLNFRIHAYCIAWYKYVALPTWYLLKRETRASEPGDTPETAGARRELVYGSHGTRAV